MSRFTTFRWSLEPRPTQEQMLLRHAGAARFAYNQSLRLVKNALDEKRTNNAVIVRGQAST